jgi:hypothetical protein
LEFEAGSWIVIYTGQEVRVESHTPRGSADIHGGPALWPSLVYICTGALLWDMLTLEKPPHVNAVDADVDGYSDDMC